MHILNRFLTWVVSCALLVPVGAFAFVTLQDRSTAEQSLQSAIERAANSYRARQGVQAVETRGVQKLTDQGQQLLTIDQRKRRLREDILSLRKTLEVLQVRYGEVIGSAAEARTLLAQEEERFVSVLHDTYLHRLAASNTDRPERRTWVAVSLTDNAPAYLTPAEEASSIEQSHIRYLQDLSLAEQTYQHLDTLTAERDTLLAHRADVSQQVDSVQQLVQVSDAQMQQIKAITAEVHSSVLTLQGELARIDAQLKSKAERALLQKGLIDPSEIASHAALAAHPAFQWPVNGPVSAGFHDARYMEYFGLPHEGVDIVVPQGTSVASAADGIVFLVRDGGATGYTYVLIGHRNGFATLYGHLSAVAVTAGQEVTAGQVIGLSGGTPGTQGAGPMTTAAHLHFEVIQAGANIDPVTVLPARG